MRLIVNADDFGRTTEINAAVAQAHDTGILTSASLMVAEPGAAEAVALARQRPGLAVGLHLVVLGGRAVLPREEIPLLVGEQGRFPRGGFAAGVRYFFSPAARAQLAKEMRAQFDAFQRTGLRLSHVDGHHHMHLHPTVFALLLPLAQEYGAHGVRVSVADDLLFSLRGDRMHLWLKAGWKVAFFFLAANGRRLLRRHPVPAAGRVYGLMQTGHVSAGYLVRLLARIARRPRSAGAASVVEIFCHPSLRDESRGLGPNLGDLAAIVSPAVAQEIAAGGIRLTTYPETFSAGATRATEQIWGAHRIGPEAGGVQTSSEPAE